MSIIKKIANHFRGVYFGGNWTWSNLKDNLEGISWEVATEKLEGFNTIAALTYHIHYFVRAQIHALETGELNANDKYSYDVPELKSPEEWSDLVQTCLKEGEHFISLLETLDDEVIWKTFIDEKYGDYYRNFHGMIEHTHYHLGQIVILRKMIERN